MLSPRLLEFLRWPKGAKPSDVFSTSIVIKRSMEVYRCECPRKELSPLSTFCVASEQTSVHSTQQKDEQRNRIEGREGHRLSFFDCRRTYRDNGGLNGIIRWHLQIITDSYSSFFFWTSALLNPSRPEEETPLQFHWKRFPGVSGPRALARRMLWQCIILTSTLS